MIHVGMIGSIIPYSFMKGPSVHRTELSDALIKLDCQVSNIFSYKVLDIKEYTNCNNYNIIPIKHFITLHEIGQMIEFRKKIDLFHVHFFGHLFYKKLDKKRPVICTCYGYFSNELVDTEYLKPGSPAVSILNFIEKRFLLQADKIITVGRSVSDYLSEIIGIPRNRIEYIPNGVNIKVFYQSKEIRHQCREEMKINDNTKIILYAKSLTNQNGILTLLKAFKKIFTYDKNIILLVLGNGPLISKVMEYKSKLFKDRLIWKGEISHSLISRYMNAADLFVLPSIPLGKINNITLGEVSPISLREALACGLPAIASNFGGNKELFDDAKKEISEDIIRLIPPNNSDILADTIIELLEKKEYTNNMAKTANNYVTNNLSWENIAIKTINTYRMTL